MKRIFTFLTILFLLSGMVKTWAGGTHNLPFPSEGNVTDITFKITGYVAQSGTKLKMQGEGKGNITVSVKADGAASWAQTISQQADGNPEIQLSDDFQTAMTGTAILNFKATDGYTLKGVMIEGADAINSMTSSVVTGGGDEPGPQPSEKTSASVWTGSFNTGSWENSLTLKFENSDFKAGDEITLTLSGTHAGDNNSQIQLGYQNGETKVWAMNGSNDFFDVNTDTSFKLTLTDDFAAALNEGKTFIVNGRDITITDISITSLKTEGVTATPTDIPAISTATVWTGSVATNDWGNGLTLYFSNSEFKAGDIITLKLTGTSEGSQIQAGYEDDTQTGGYHWAMDGDNNYFTINAATEHKITLDEAWATALNAGKGLRVNGINITIASVDITSLKTEGVTASEPKPVDPYEGWTKFPSEDLAVAMSDWNLYPRVIKQDGMAEIREGDVICVEFTPGTGDLNFQYGFGCKEGDTFDGYNVKNDETYGYGAYRYYGTEDHTTGIKSPYYITVDEVLARQLNEGKELWIRGTNFTINKITALQNPDRRNFIWVPLFVPDASMAGKKNYGYGPDKDNDMEISDWMGTAKVVEMPAGSGNYAVKFFHEWWDTDEEGNIADDADENKKNHAEQLGEKHSLPLRLRRANVPNFALLKVGDMLRINVTCYTDLSEDTNTISTCAEKSSQAQLGTYDPTLTPGPDPEKPLQAFVPFSIGDKGANYKDWGQSTENKVIDFEIGAVMLKYITRYGLSINGRKFYLNSVYAKVYTDEDNNTTETEYVIHDYFYNKTIEPSAFTDMTDHSSVYIFMEDGNNYTEHRIAKYEDKDFKNFIGYETEYFDEPQEMTDASRWTEPEISVRFKTSYEGTLTWERLHVAAYLYDNHFPADKKEDAETRMHAPDKAKEDPNAVIPIENVAIRTYTDENGRKVFAFAALDQNIVDQIKANGISLRGKKFAHIDEVRVDPTLTGILGVEADSTNESIDYNAPYEVYNLQGIRVSEPLPGALHIVRQGNKVEKVIIR